MNKRILSHNKGSNHKGDVITRTVIGLLSNHLPRDYTIAEPNGYIDGCPVEFDILILRKNSVPVLPYSNVHEREDGKSIIECKKQGFFYKKSLSQTKIVENFKNLERAGLPYKYITIRESRRIIEATRSVLPEDKSFFLGISAEKWINGEWERFVKSVMAYLNCKQK